MRVLSALEVGSPFFIATYKILSLVDRKEETVEEKKSVEKRNQIKDCGVTVHIMLQLWCCNTNKSVPTADGWFCLYFVYCHTALCEGFHRAFTTSPSVLCICKYGLCGVHLSACFVKCNLAVGSSTELITLCYRCSTVRGLFWSCSVVLLSSDAPLYQLISIRS